MTARLQWLARRFGLEGLRARKTVVPTPEFFPHRFDGSDEAVEELVIRLCKPYGVDPRLLDVHVYAEEDPNPLELPRADGATSCSTPAAYVPQGDGRAWIAVGHTLLDDPPSLAAAIAHENAHALLLGRGHLDGTADDEEPTTDLATVFFGLGVLTANAAIRSRGWHDGAMQHWQSSRLGYLSQAQLGYALAACAWARGERKPQWSRHLRGDVAQVVRQSLNWFEAHGRAPLPGSLRPRARRWEATNETSTGARARPPHGSRRARG